METAVKGNGWMCRRSGLTSFPEKEDEMFTLQLILADGVTIKLGHNVWTFGLNFIIYLQHCETNWKYTFRLEDSSEHAFYLW